MFKLQAKKTELCLLEREPVTSGSVNVYEAAFAFSEDWAGLEKTAVFRAGSGKPVSVLLGPEETCAVPWEVLQKPGVRLEAGVYGTRGEETVLPTVWADLGYIHTGAAPAGGLYPPTPEIWHQELARKGDNIDYDGLNLRLRSGAKVLSEVQVSGGGGGIIYKFGHGLKQDGLDVSVNAVSDFSGDNTLPMTAAGVQTTVGNIEALLATI